MLGCTVAISDGGSDGADYTHAMREASRLLKLHNICAPPVPVDEISRNYIGALEVGDFSAEHGDVCGLIDLVGNRMVINRDDPITRQRFTIAHELGHLILHREKLEDNRELGVLFRRPIGGENKVVEQEANCFAANLLVPWNLLKPLRGKHPTILAGLFAVSREVIGFRLQDAKRMGWFQ